LDVERARQTWKEVVDKDTNDLHTELSDAMDHSKWTVTIRGNWSDSDSDSDAKSSVPTVCFWCWFTEVNLD